MLAVITSYSIQALPVGNPSEASLLTWGVFLPPGNYNAQDPCCCWFDAWSLRVGYYGDFVFNRHLKIEGMGLGQGKDIQKTVLNTNAGYLALNIGNQLDFFGTVGASHIHLSSNEISWFTTGDTEGRFNWDPEFSWSAGGRATLISRNCWTIGVEGQYFETIPDLSYFISYSDGVYNYFNKHQKMKYSEWQGAVGLSYTLTCCCSNVSLIPYGAAKFAWSRFNTKNFQFIKAGTLDTYTLFNMKAAKVFGYAIGLTTTFCQMVCVTVEGRFADETAFYVNGNFRF